MRYSHNHSIRLLLHNAFTSCRVGTRGTTNSSSMQADIHLCQSRLVLTSKLCPCWMRVGTTCQANFPQVSHCLSNSLTDLTDMQSKFANCNMQWQGREEREERVQTKGGWIPRPLRQCNSAALWSQNVTERMHEISHKYHVHQPSRASAQWLAEKSNEFCESTARQC